MAIIIQDIINQLEKGIPKLVENNYKGYLKQAKSDGQTILKMLENDLRVWTTQLAEKKLKEDEFQDLLLDQKDKLESVALKEAGLAAIRLDQFKQDILDLIFKTVKSAI